MSVVRITDHLTDHPRLVGVSDRAFRLFIAGLCYSARYETDWFIPTPMPRKLVTGGARAALELVDAGLWEQVMGGYRPIRDVPTLDWDELGDYRAPIPERQKVIVAERLGCRDGTSIQARCWYCDHPGLIDRKGIRVRLVGLTFDHIRPVALRGSNLASNLLLACSPCNSSRGHRTTASDFWRQRRSRGDVSG